MRRDPMFWVALGMAFVLGLVPGLGIAAYQRRATELGNAGLRAELEARQKTWTAEKDELSRQVASAEASVAALSSRVTSLTARAARLKSTPAQDQEEPSAAGKTSPVILERGVEGPAHPGKPLTLVVKVRGDADKVTMRLVQSRPDTGWVKTYPLVDGGDVDGVHIWRQTIECPAQTGEYRFFADAYLGNIHVTMPGVSAWSFLVE